MKGLVAFSPTVEEARSRFAARLSNAWKPNMDMLTTTRVGLAAFGTDKIIQKREYTVADPIVESGNQLPAGGASSVATLWADTGKSSTNGSVLINSNNMLTGWRSLFERNRSPFVSPAAAREAVRNRAPAADLDVRI